MQIATNQTKHWESPAKSLEKDIDKDRYDQFQQTTSNLNAENIKTAFKKALKLSEKLFEQLDVDRKLKQVLIRIE
ncbi:hypothetical protein [Olivibacter sp. SDN3]|uniref:hypothetical protein n=1 Tax=Olivibacter sp. SDN3 TaxID=2764720 RepID=UPI00351B0A01